jgi:hypothetical protein
MGPTTLPGIEPGSSTDDFPIGPRRTAVWDRHGQGLEGLALTIPLLHPVEMESGDVQTMFPSARGR